MSAPAATLSKLLAWRPGGYLRASGVLFGWLAVRTAAQAALFVLVARTLGAEGYGSLIAVMAIATLFAPLAGLGGQSLLVRDGARNPWHIPRYLGDALRLWALTVVPLCAVAFAACRLLVPSALPGYAIAAIVLADLACTSLLDVLARTWQAAQRMASYGASMAGLVALRLVAICALPLVVQPTPAVWSVCYGGATAIYAIAIIGAVIKQFGPPRPSGSSVISLAGAGFPFAFAGSAMRVQAEANKPLLAGLHTLTGAGVFSAAQRVTDVVVVPLTAAVEALLPRAYAAQRPLQTVLRIGIGPICIALLGGCFLFLLAPYAPLLLGASFIGAEAAIKTLALLPTLLVARLLLTVALAAHGSQRYFLSVYGAGAIISISATAWWVPIFGMNGAIAAAYVTELSLIALQGRQLVRAH